MATLKTPRRSVSPFGLKVEESGPFASLKISFETAFGKPHPDEKPSLESFSKAAHVPYFIEKLFKAAANDAPDLETLCQFLLTHKIEFEARELGEILFESMATLFDQKTEIFLIGDNVLFAKERDALIGRYFSPITEKNPGLFSEFVTKWVETENLDRLLHVLDFSAGAKNPTFEHYLVFAHPSLKRIVTNKNQLRSLVKKTEPLLKKLASPTWEPALLKALEI